MMHHKWEQRPSGYLWHCTACGVEGGSHAATREEVAEKHVAHECPALLRAALERADATVLRLARKSKSRGRRIEQLQDQITASRTRPVWHAPVYINDVPGFDDHRAQHARYLARTTPAQRRDREE